MIPRLTSWAGAGPWGPAGWDGAERWCWLRVSLQAWAGAWWPRSSGSQEAEAEAAAAWGLLGLAASPEEEGAGQEAGLGAGRGRAQGLAAPEATWLVGQGLQGLELVSPATCLPPPGRWAQVCQSAGGGGEGGGLGAGKSLA